MTELTEREARELAGALRPKRRPLLLAVSANLVMAVLLLGVPYVRGRLLARQQRRDYVGFVQCMLGGHPPANPGLSLPRGEREHYATKVLFANADWPLSCRPALKRLRPPEATFLWPSLKAAGVDLRDAIDLVDRELVALAKHRTQASGRVPQRPLDAIKRLQAATLLFTRAGDEASDVDNDSVVLEDRSTRLPVPARLPMMIGEYQDFLPWSHDGVLQLLAFDSHNLTYLRVGHGAVDRNRFRRNSYTRGVTRAGDTPYLVWAMPEARCIERADRCSRRPTGLARYDEHAEHLDEPSWKLAGHPAERLDRGLIIAKSGRIDFLRRSSARGGIEWIRSRLPDALSANDAAKPQQLETQSAWSVLALPDPEQPDTDAAADTAAADTADEEAPASPDAVQPKLPAPVPSSATLVRGEPMAVLCATGTDPDSPPRSEAGGESGIQASLIFATQPARSLALEPVKGDIPWAAACVAGAERWLAYGSSSELRMAHLADDQSVRALSAQTVALGTPLDPDDAGADRLRLLCEPGRAQLLLVGEDRQLRELHCDATSCTKARPLSPNVAEFDAVLRRGLGLIAFQQGLLDPTIKLLRLDERLEPVGEPTIAGICWQPLGGMCGRPSLLADAQRIALLTRDGPDLLAIETINNGRTFSPLSGAPAKRSFDSSTTSPLKQHRLRKGTD